MAVDLRGSAQDRLAQLDELVIAEGTTDEWLLRHLRLALGELAALEPVLEMELERREDY
ncbi:hypothetical protein [uncultured Leifsonia sp.]|uniref:hypothetical protein n=1 Tax=uncultured Leifsonia sp. TaxID=340359 RepID=UPI0028D56CA6|nr:hypothetical protein [uncultured Leifsonia sp.]